MSCESMSNKNPIKENENAIRAFDAGTQAGETTPSPSVRNTSNYKISPYLRSVLIKRELGGFSSWDVIPNHLKGQFLYKALIKWRKKVIMRFGSQTNYLRYWVVKKGYKNLTDYKYQKSTESGFKNYRDYLNFLYIRKGFKGKADYERFKRFIT